MADSFPLFCSKCGCSLNSTFQFCPKCGLKIVLRTSPAEVKKEPKSSLLNFKDFKAKKENERSSFSIRRGKGAAKKQKVVDETVTIHVGVMNEEFNIKRGETLPLKIGSRACADEIRVAAIKKHSDFNQRFDKKAEYKLLFRDGTDVEFIPGTNEPFLLRRYKEESGFGYARITLYLFAPENNTHDEVKKEGSERLYISSDELSDEELMKPVFLAQSQPSQSSASTPFTPIAGPSGVMMIDCPTCWQSFAISDIESHADMCAQKVADFSDPFEQEEDNLIAPPAVYKGIYFM